MSARPAEVTTALDVSATACRHARQLVRTTLESWGCPEELIDDALLIANELVANVVDHAYGPLGLAIIPRAAGVLIEVSDGSSTAPELHWGAVDSARQRGLQLVSALSSNWGHTITSNGKTVWAELQSK